MLKYELSAFGFYFHQAHNISVTDSWFQEFRLSMMGGLGVVEGEFATWYMVKIIHTISLQWIWRQRLSQVLRTGGMLSALKSCARHYLMVLDMFIPFLKWRVSLRGTCPQKKQWHFISSTYKSDITINFILLFCALVLPKWLQELNHVINDKFS